MALAALKRAGHGDFAEVLDAYADAAEQIARADLAHVARRAGLDDLVESAVVGTVLGDSLIASLRRLAQADGSARVYENDDILADGKPRADGRTPGKARPGAASRTVRATGVPGTRRPPAEAAGGP
jgi:hypothetical protein